jgi:hypothetical protein
MANDPTTNPWLLLIHQLPPQPAYLRVKIGRRLAKVGAVALKNSVYVLPHSEGALEDFQWIAREIEEDGGDATVSGASFLNGVSDEDVANLFRQARDVDFQEIASGARQAIAAIESGADSGGQSAKRELMKLQRHLEEVGALDFFQAPARQDAETTLIALKGRITGEAEMGTSAPQTAKGGAASYKGRTWVTRTGVKVDRMASAWLIRRWIDPAARFKFVPAKGYQPAEGELRFDMFEAEFTHEGSACTFEVLLQKLGPQDAALNAIAELIHDIDLKDSKYDRPETAGLARMLEGIAMANPSDDARLERGGVLFDELYGTFSRGA